MTILHFALHDPFSVYSQSLHAVLVSDEARWRQRGHGFRDQKPAQDQSQRRQHTVEMIGSLMERVQMLAADQEALMTK